MSLTSFKGNFQQEIGNKEKVIVKFKTEWCSPCKVLHPIIEEVSKEVKDVSFIEVDAEEHSELAARYGVMSVPALLFFKRGEEVERLQGVYPKEYIMEKIHDAFE